MDFKNNKLFLKGIKYLKLNDIDNAYKIFNPLYKNFSFDETIILYYGYVLALMQNYRLALKVWKKLNDFSVGRIKYLLLYSFINVKQGEITEAIKAWLEILKLDPKNKKAKKLLKEAKTSRNIKLFSKYLKFEDVYGKLPYYNIPLKKLENIDKIKIKKKKYSNEKNLIKNYGFIIVFIIIFLIFSFNLPPIAPDKSPPSNTPKTSSESHDFSEAPPLPIYLE